MIIMALNLPGMTSPWWSSWWSSPSSSSWWSWLWSSSSPSSWWSSWHQTCQACLHLSLRLLPTSLPFSPRFGDDDDVACDTDDNNYYDDKDEDSLYLKNLMIISMMMVWPLKRVNKLLQQRCQRWKRWWNDAVHNDASDEEDEEMKITSPSEDVKTLQSHILIGHASLMESGI